MATDYLNFFNLNDDPFRLTPDTAYFYNSPAHSTALLSLEYCVTQKEGFCILTGEPGTGKTTIIRLFIEKWKSKAEIALVMTPHLSPDEFFRAILDDFRIPLSTSKNDMLKDFRSFLLQHASNNKRVTIIVDEAQELPLATLEELRLLSNLETEKEKLLQIILIGQPELRTKLLSAPLRQLNQRITVRVQLKPLNEAETSDYINTRLIKGGNSSLLFNQKAKDLIYNHSGGIPRTINLLASRGLMSAFLDGSKEVFDRHVEKGAADIMEPLASAVSAKTAVPAENRNINSTKQPKQSVSASKVYPKKLIWLVLLLLIASGAGAAFYIFDIKSLSGIKKSAPEHLVSGIVMKPVSSVRMTVMSSSRQATPNPNIRPADDKVVADPQLTAISSFNVIAQAWHVAPAQQQGKAEQNPDKFLENASNIKGLQLFEFYGTLDQLLDLDYPAIIVNGPSSSGHELYTALIKTGSTEFSVTPPVGGKGVITREGIKTIWRGKAMIIWKNHLSLPSNISLGKKHKGIFALQRLLNKAGITVSRSGIFDLKTTEALKSFQHTKGLGVTGQPDPLTMLYLYKYSTDFFRPKTN